MFLKNVIYFTMILREYYFKAENTKLILWSIRVSEIREESINTVSIVLIVTCSTVVDMLSLRVLFV